MTDLVEACARALCCPNGCRKGNSKWSICQAHTFRDDARAVIPVVLNSLREPTPEMLDALIGIGQREWTERAGWRAAIDVAILALKPEAQS